MQKEDKKINWETVVLKSFAIAFAAGGFIVLIVFLFKLKSEYTIWGESTLDMTKTGQTGDFVGGLVGSIWSFAGVLLFFLSLKLQREEFELQRKELENQRFEFQATRLTNIANSQTIQILSAVRELRFQGITQSSGIAGIVAVNKFFTTSNNFLINPELYNGNISDEMSTMHMVSDSIIDLNRIITSFSKPILHLLKSSTLNAEQKSEIAQLFIGNIDNEIINNIQKTNLLTAYWIYKNVPKEMLLPDAERDVYMSINQATRESLDLYEEINTFIIKQTD